MSNIMGERANFGSKLGVILATAGSAVGLGNVWRFPYMTGENGGAVFIMIYVICVVLLGIPCMVSEFIVGRHGQSNTARAYRKLAGGTPWSLIGYMGVLTGFLITGYYAVVSGWCLQYIFASLIGHLQGDPEYFKTYFTELATHPVKPVLWTVIILGITYLIIEHGVRDGIERASKLLMPTLFILLLIIVGASCMLPDADDGIEFLFKPDYDKLTGDVFLGALGQSFYSLSIAMGCLCTYASYFSRYTNLTKSASQIAIIGLSGGYPGRSHDFPRSLLGRGKPGQRSFVDLHHIAQCVPAGFCVNAFSGLLHLTAVLRVVVIGSIDLVDVTA